MGAVLSSTAVLIQGGLLVAPGGVRREDVRIIDGVVAEIGRLTQSRGDRVVQAEDCFVLPGLVDLHVHLADEINGVVIADDVASGTQAAVLQGITTTCTFVTQRSGETLEEATARFSRRIDSPRTDMVVHLTPTGESWDWLAIERLHDRGLRTIKLYTTYREAGLYCDYLRLEKIMARLRELDLGLLVHCEDEGVLQKAAALSIDRGDARYHGRLRPPESEVRAVERVVAAAAATGCRTHIVHVSTNEAAAVIDSARSDGAPVTCETGPQYLLLDEDVFGPPDGHRFLCTPPLRSKAIRAALESQLIAGSIDLLATDHCPFSRADKDANRDDFPKVPNGLPGVGALLDLAWELIVDRLGLSPSRVVELLATNPARIAGVYPAKGELQPGSDGDVVVLDPSGPPRAVQPSLADCWSPWQGRESRLSVRHVFIRGQEVVADGQVRDVCAIGRLIAPSLGKP